MLSIATIPGICQINKKEPKSRLDTTSDFRQGGLGIKISDRGGLTEVEITFDHAFQTEINGFKHIHPSE
jgi:hypothetical protein